MSHLPLRTPIFFLFVWLVFQAKIYSQCSVTPWMSPTLLESDASFGTYSFNAVANGASSDDQYAEATSTIALFSGNTQYLKVSGFGFSIPASATVCGIEVQIERSADNIGLFTSVEDASVRLLKNGSVAGSNRASNTNWTTTDVTANYGSSSDGWLASLVPNDINQSGFGVAVAASINGLVSLLPVARIDRVRMRVHYMVSLPLHNIQLQVNLKNGLPCVLLSYDQSDISSIILERSSDQQRWYPVHRFASSKIEEWIDRGAEYGDYYYRLKVTERNGRVFYSAIRHVNIGSSREISISNPVYDKLIINSAAGFSKIDLYDFSGQQMLSRTLPVVAHHYELPLPDMRPGLYILIVNNKAYKIIKR